MDQLSGEHGASSLQLYYCWDGRDVGLTGSSILHHNMPYGAWSLLAMLCYLSWHSVQI